VKLFFALFAALALNAGTASDLAEELRSIELDTEECYRVRDVHFSRDELKLYLTDGWLVFAKPVAGRRVAAVFLAEPAAGDAEILLMPPTKGERVSLARFTESPNLNEHFTAAVMLFTDGTETELREAIYRTEPRKSPENGLLIQTHWQGTVRNLAASFLVRLVEQTISQTPPAQGLFYAAISGKKLGNFDVVHDPEAKEQIYLGRLVNKENRLYYDTWTNFESRSFRTGERKPLADPFRIERYVIESVLEPDLHLRVHSAATIVPTRTVRVAAFELSSRMSVTAVRINGEEAEILERASLRANLLRSADSGQFLVIPPQPLEPGRAYQVEFEHDGKVIADAGKNVYYVGSRGTWYPRAGTGFSHYDMTFTFPDRLQLVFPGDIKDDVREETMRSVRRVTSEPIRMAGFNLGDYESEKVAKGQLTVEVFANRSAEPALRPRMSEMIMIPQQQVPFGRNQPRRAPEVVPMPPPPAPDPTARLRDLAEEIASAFDYLAARLGPPAQPHLMVSPIPGTFGQGFPGLVYLSTLSYLDPNQRAPIGKNPDHQVFFSEILHAHEAAHQWWGNVVMPAKAHDDWMMEALANYSALLVFEKKKGVRALSEMLDRYRKHLLSTDESGATLESAGPLRLGMRLESSLAPGAWRAIVYEKGTWVMHMLRKRLGDAGFFALVSDFLRENRYQAVSTEQFRALAARTIDPKSPDAKLEGFFENWVNATGVPNLIMTTSLKGKAPALKLTITIAQTGVEDPFSALVPVEIQMARGPSKMIWLETGAEPVSETVSVRARPTKVLLDPGGAVLKQ
jgi:hypothetical protein